MGPVGKGHALSDTHLAEAVDKDILTQGGPIADLDIPGHVHMRRRINIDMRADPGAERPQNRAPPREARPGAQTQKPATEAPQDAPELLSPRVFAGGPVGGVVKIHAR